MKKNSSKFFGVLGVLIALMMISAPLMAAGADTKTIPADEIDAIINTSTDASQVTSPFIQVANQVRNSVVGVNNYTVSSSYYGYGFNFGYGFPGEQRESLSGTGSGVVITKYGHVLTNFHVVEGASRVTVTIANDESEHEAQVVGYDANLDIAVLHVPGLTLTPVPLGDSDQLQVGEWAIVIGNPLGEDFARTLTVGVVSAIDRKVTDTSTDRYGRRTSITNTMIQVDAAINSGNSGGGMFNTLGQLQGIPARKYSSSGFYSTSIDNIGMCIPINVAKPLIEQVLRAYKDEGPAAPAGDEKADADVDANNPLRGKPRLGISGTHLTSNLNGALPLGVLVKTVEQNSPAENGGILPGDIIVELDGEVITAMSQLQNGLAGHQEGDQVQIKVYRDANLAEQVNAQSGENGLRIDTTKLGEGEYIDLTITLRIVDDMAF
ncbi:MAG: PDZ domain-containing protein [Clostridiales bacterium]|nr:PDZ domain-containing protein [Clostridiales bacterium]